MTAEHLTVCVRAQFCVAMGEEFVSLHVHSGSPDSIREDHSTAGAQMVV